MQDMKLSFDQKIVLLFTRLAMGWLFSYAGFIKIVDPSWTAKTYIAGTNVFPEFFRILLRPDILPKINLLNEWGLLLIGAALIAGSFIRFTSFFGFVLMIIYYLPIYPPEHEYIVNIHIIYALVFLMFMVFPAGHILGLDALFEKLETARKHPWFRALLG